MSWQQTRHERHILKRVLEDRRPRPPASLIGAPLNTLNNSVLQLWNRNIGVQQLITKVDTKLVKSVVNRDHMCIRGWLPEGEVVPAGPWVRKRRVVVTWFHDKHKGHGINILHKFLCRALCSPSPNWRFPKVWGEGVAMANRKQRWGQQYSVLQQTSKGETEAQEGLQQWIWCKHARCSPSYMGIPRCDWVNWND